jgi:predicted ArsR family transcriptional regulator
MKFTAGTTYSREKFIEIFSRVNAGDFLSGEILRRINEALESNDDAFLSEIYDVLLSLHSKNEVLDSIFEERNEALIADYANSINALKKEADLALRNRMLMVENKEKEEAEQLLSKL